MPGNTRKYKTAIVQTVYEFRVVIEITNTQMRGSLPGWIETQHHWNHVPKPNHSKVAAEVNQKPNYNSDKTVKKRL